MRSWIERILLLSVVMIDWEVRGVSGEDDVEEDGDDVDDRDGASVVSND